MGAVAQNNSTNSGGSVMSPAQINALGVQALSSQPVKEFIVGTYQFSDSQTQQVKIPNLGVLAGILLRVKAHWTFDYPLTPLPDAHVSSLFSALELRLSDGSIRHQGSRGYQIQNVLDGYRAFPRNVPIQTPNGSSLLDGESTIWGMDSLKKSPVNRFPAINDSTGSNVYANGLMYVPCEIPAGGMFEGGYNLTDPQRGNADNYIKISVAKIDDYFSAGADATIYKPFSCFGGDAAALTETTVAEIEVEVTMMYREPTNVLPVLALSTIYSIDSTYHQAAKQNGNERFEIEASGYTYLQVQQQFSDAGILDIKNPVPVFKKTSVVENGANQLYERDYLTQLARQGEAFPYHHKDLLIHDWRNTPKSAITNGSLVIVNTFDATGLTSPIISTTYERLRRGN